MTWTDDVIAQLRDLWTSGMSANAIGRSLGLSKSAIIGKAHRLDLPARPSPIVRDGRIRPAPKSVRTPMRSFTALQVATKRSVEVASKAAPPVSSTISDNLLGHRSKVTVCRWPIGEPGTRSFRFCDQPALAGKSYCDEHARRAYGGRQRIAEDSSVT